MSGNKELEKKVRGGRIHHEESKDIEDVAGKETEKREFKCLFCDFVVEYHYFGQKPPFTKDILLLEDCYIMKDPFSTSGGFICVGGSCSLCRLNVCMSATCSMFYTKRFCLKCITENIEEFPSEIKQEVFQKMNNSS